MARQRSRLRRVKGPYRLHAGRGPRQRGDVEGRHPPRPAPDLGERRHDEGALRHAGVWNGEFALPGLDVLEKEYIYVERARAKPASADAAQRGLHALRRGEQLAGLQRGLETDDRLRNSGWSAKSCGAVSYTLDAARRVVSGSADRASRAAARKPRRSPRLDPREAKTRRRGLVLTRCGPPRHAPLSPGSPRVARAW